MSRSGYYESDGDDPLAEGRFIAVWNKTRKGKRGQKLAIAYLTNQAAGAI